MKRRPLAITIIGVLGIIWGILALISSVLIWLQQIHALVFKFPPGFEIFRVMMISPIVGLLVMGISFIIAGIGVLKLKAWGREVFLVIGCLLILQVFLGFLIFGSFLKFYRTLVTIGISTALLYFFNKKDIRNIFIISDKILKAERCFYLVGIIGIIFVEFVYVWFLITWLIPQQPYLFYTPQKIEYKLQDEKVPEGHRKRSLLNFNLYLPSDFYMNNFSYDSATGASLFLMAPDKTNVLVVTDKSIFELMKPLGQIFSINDSYDFGKQFVYEKIGVVFLALKSITMVYSGKFDEVFFGHWKGFVQTGIGNGRRVYEYSLWQKETGSVAGLTFITKEGGLSSDLVKSIVSTLHIKDVPKNPDEYFQQGLEFMKQTQYEEAKLSFANALYHNWKNPEYHFYLARAFFETGNNHSAKKHLEQAISLRSDYIEAKALIERLNHQDESDSSK